MAQNKNGRLWFTAGIDRSELSKGVTAINKDFAGLRQNAQRTGDTFSGMWKTAASGISTYLSVTAALDLSSQIVDLTRQRELMEKSFEVMFGGVDTAQQKIKEFNEYAIFSPYAFDGIAKGAQTLSAFGTKTEDLLPTIRMIGDVAAGNAQRFDSLILAFAQASSAGRLMGQDLLQMINGGFNPLQVIAEQTGKSMLALKKDMEKGLISFDMVTDAFKSATSEGGKFYGMTTKMADSIEAAKSTFESAWVEKQIEWGKAAGDNIQTMYEFGTIAVENADTIAKAFAGLIATVGTYKAAMIALSAYETTHAGIIATEAAAMVSRNAALGLTMSLETAETIVKGKLTAATVLQTLATKAGTVAVAAFNAVMSVNPIVLVVTALAAATAGYALFRKETEKTTASLTNIQQASKDTGEQMLKEKANVKSLSDTVRDSTLPMLQRLDALKKLKKLIPEYNAELTKEGKVIKDNTLAINNYLATKEREIKSKIYETQLQELYVKQMEQEATLKRAESAEIISTPDNSQASEFLQKQKEDVVKLNKQLLQSTNDQIAEIKAEIAKGFGSTTKKQDKTELTEEQKRAIEAAKRAAKEEADARREAFQKMLTDYENFEQARERIQKEHEDRKVVITSETQDLQIREQLIQASRDQRDAEIRDAEETHRTKEFLRRENLKADIEARRAYIENYGTTAQKEFAIRQEYDKKIKEASTASQKELLKAQRDTELSDISTESLIQQMDWASILGDAGDQFGDLIEKALSDSRAYLETDEFKNASTETKETLLEAIERMEGVVGKDGIDFKGVGEAMNAYRNNLNELTEARNKEIEQLQRLEAAQKAYDKAKRKGTKEEVNSAQKNLEAARKNADASSENVKKIQAQTKKSLAAVGTATQQLKVNLEGLVEGLSGVLQSGSFSGILEGITKIGESLDGAIGDMLDTIKEIPFLGEIAAILDLIKDGITPLLDNISGLITGILDSILDELISGDLFVSIYKLAENVLNSAADFITLGAFDITGKRRAIREEVYKKNAEIADRELVAQYEINALYRERYEWERKIGETAKRNAERQRDEAEKQIRENQADQADLLRSLQKEEYIDSYSFRKTGLFGWGKGKEVENRKALAGLSYEDILALEAQGKLTEGAQILLDALRDSVEEGENLKDVLEDAQVMMQEATVGMGLDETVRHAMDELFDGTVSAAEAFDEIMNNAAKGMLEQLMTEDVKKWYEGFAKAGADGYTDAERAYWKKRWEEMQAENEERKQEVEDITGTDLDKPSTGQGQADANAITAIQEEAPGSIDGKLTALQLTSSQTATNTSNMAVGISDLRVSVTQLRDGMDVLNSSVSNIHKEAKLIRQYTSELPAMAKDIKTVVTNTKNL